MSRESWSDAGTREDVESMSEQGGFFNFVCCISGASSRPSLGFLSAVPAAIRNLTSNNLKTYHRQAGRSSPTAWVPSRFLQYE